MGVEVALAHSREVMRRERRTARAGRVQFVLRRLDELRHRHTGNDERRHGRHRLLHRCDRPAHRVELFRRLHPPEVDDELRARAQPVGAEDARELQRGLGPDAVSDGDGAGGVQAARDALEDRRPVVGAAAVELVHLPVDAGAAAVVRFGRAGGGGVAAHRV